MNLNDKIYVAGHNGMVGSALVRALEKKGHENFIFKTKKLVRYHMHLLFLSKNMHFADEKGLIKNVDINDISLVFLSDRTGRGGITKKKEKDIESQVSKFHKKYSKIEIVDK